MSTCPETSTRAVDPARLAPGAWCHRTEKTIGQGDINASYSADRIGMGQPVRRPFSWQGGLWVCVGLSRRNGVDSAQAYRLTHPSIFEGTPVTYAQKTLDGDAARSDPLGFYHGMNVRHGAEQFVLCGPPVTFVPGETEQFSLFGDLL
jgi:hypothetical protein